VEVGKTFGSPRFESARGEAQSGAAEAHQSPRSNVIAYPTQAHVTPETGVAAAAARAPQAQAYLSMWVALDPASLRVVEDAQRLATSNIPILIHGEPGTGKRLLATLIHELANAAAPLIYFSPESLPPALVESELCGDESSAYVQRGRVELAHGGTLIIDELAALPPTAQLCLLHIIEEKNFVRPGGTRPVACNVRVIALTSLNAGSAETRSTINGGLLAHFAAASLAVPALRHRPADISALASRFLDTWTALHGVTRKVLAPSAITALQAYDFPGNISELKHIVEHCAAHCTGDEIALDHLPRYVTQISSAVDGTRSLEDVEREHIAKVLHFTNGRKTEAADILGISRKTLLEKRKRYGLG
jgi:DNA-binding NtrC family response regulator